MRVQTRLPLTVCHAFSRARKNFFHVDIVGYETNRMWFSVVCSLIKNVVGALIDPGKKAVVRYSVCKRSLKF